MKFMQKRNAFCPIQSLPSWERGLKSLTVHRVLPPHKVAPLVGAWIEITFLRCKMYERMSLPSWERGLKFKRNLQFSPCLCVAPLVGAWIEIMADCICPAIMAVAPLVGAWIEIGVINYSSHSPLMSLPSWERGLKFRRITSDRIVIVSLPSWKRGLKYLSNHQPLRTEQSLPSWERGLKYENPISFCRCQSRSPRGSVD